MDVEPRRTDRLRRPAEPDPARPGRFLGGLHHPVSKDDILDRAKEEGADKDVLQMLDRIPDKEYPSPVEISREVGKSND